MKEKKKFGFISQGYEAPRAEAYTMTQEAGILSSSVPTTPVTGNGFQFQNQGEGKW